MTVALILLVAPTMVAQNLAAQQAARHEKLVNEVEAIVTVGGNLGTARSRLVEAYRISRSTRADFYHAWLLCAEQSSRQDGAAVFRKILQNDRLSANQESLVRQELGKCQARAVESRVAAIQRDYFFIVSSLKGVEWSEPLYLRNSTRLRLHPWSEVIDARKEIASALSPRTQIVARQPFLLAGRRTTKYLDQLVATVLEPYRAHLRERMGLPEHDAIIYVFVAEDHDSMSAMTRLFYEVGPGSEEVLDRAIAYNDPKGSSMMAICGPDPANCSSFAHEMFHLLNSARFPDAPWWIEEGIAELYESGDLVAGEFRPRVSWRQTYLGNDPITAASLRRLLELSRNDRALREPPGAAIDMAQASFFCQYLHKDGKLWPVYSALRDRQWGETVRDPSGVAAVEKLMGRPLGAIASDFNHWVATKVLPVKPSTRRP